MASTQSLTADRPTTILRQEHDYFLTQVKLLASVAEEIPSASEEQRRLLLNRSLHFLEDELLPHAEAEEANLYPDWAELVGFKQATEFLVDDHRRISDLINILKQLSSNQVYQIQQTLYGLEALIVSHFHKEEKIVFASLDNLDEDSAIELLERFEANRYYQTPDID